MLSIITTALGFLGRLPGAALSLADRRKRWAKADRAEIDDSFKGEIDNLSAQLAEADDDQERAALRAEIKRVRKEQRRFYRASRELLLSKSLRQRLTPEAAFTLDAPELPAPERQALSNAAFVIARLEPPKTAEEYARQGNALYAAGELEKALEQYNRALELRPDYPEALHNRGVTLGNLKRYAEALADFNRALELRPDDPNTLNNRGNALSELQRSDEALVDYNLALELRPDYPEALHNRGVTLAKRFERYVEALADYSRALELRPDYPGALNNRGVTLQHLQRYEDALADYNRALQLQPDHSDTLYNRACLYSITRRLKDSLNDLKEAISRDADNRKAAREDEDFENLRSDARLGPEFERLVAG